MALIFSKLYVLFLLILLFMVSMDHTSGCQTGHGCLCMKGSHVKIQNRKMAFPFKADAVKPVIGDQLRAVPAGPDPLHHNGGSPKKPKTP